MNKLTPLPDITRLSDRVVRVLAQNPGSFTLQGTNVWIYGAQNPFTLIDAGEGVPKFIPVLERAFLEHAVATNPKEPYVSDIVISHLHRDHIDGLPSVLTLLKKLWDTRHVGENSYKPPRLHKFPSSSDSADLQTVISALPPGSYSPSPTGAPFHDLYDSQILPSSLRVVHCPGHTTDSISLYLPADRVLYTADTVLGEGTAVFEDLAAYLLTLQKLLDFGTMPDNDYTKLYPGHGPVVENAREHIETYISHRLEREAQIIEVLKAKGGTATVWEIVATLYVGYPKSVWLAAAQVVGLHLRKLEGECRVVRLDGEGKDSRWQLKVYSHHKCIM